MKYDLFSLQNRRKSLLAKEPWEDAGIWQLLLLV